MSRLTLEDNILTSISKMAESNPGALTVLTKMMNTPEAFAPAEPFIEILNLDTMGIYGSDIWSLGEYVCKGQDMDLLRQIFLNHSFGKLSREVLMDHIRNQEPFEKLYTKEELHEAFMESEHSLPLIEEERHNQLVAEGKYSKEEDFLKNFAPDPFHRDIYTPKDTSSDMSIETFIGMLEDRGFKCGCEKKIDHDGLGNKIDATWRVYYQPETGFIVPLTVVPGYKLNYYGGLMASQRKERVHFDNFRVGGNSGGLGIDGIMMYSKDIREDLFAWYDEVCKSEPCLEWKTNGSFLEMGMSFCDCNEEYYCDDCGKELGISSYNLSPVFSLSQNLCTLANMDLFDEGLMKMIHYVKEDMGKLITYELNELVNFEVGEEKTRQALDFLLAKLGKDYNWLKENGVDLEKAFLKGKDFSFCFKLNEPISIKEHHEKRMQLFIDFKERLGYNLNGKNGDKLFDYNNRIPFMADKDEKLIDRIVFKGERIGVNISEDQMEKILLELFEKNGLKCSPIKNPLCDLINNAKNRTTSISGNEILRVTFHGEHTL